MDTLIFLALGKARHNKGSQQTEALEKACAKDAVVPP